MKIKISIKLKSDLILKIIYPILILLIIGGIVSLSMFLYSDFYVAIIQAEELPDLRSKVAQDVVNINLFNNVISKIDKKINKSGLIISEINNPFTLIPASISTAPTIE